MDIDDIQLAGGNCPTVQTVRPAPSRTTSSDAWRSRRFGQLAQIDAGRQTVAVFGDIRTAWGKAPAEGDDRG